MISLCICNAICHCKLYHVTCIINAILTTQSIPLIGCHGQSHHLHMTSIHHFIHVNISYKHVLTFTFNMSFYDQATTHTQLSHVMAITHKNLSQVNILEHTLTFKHFTLSQAMTHSNKYTMASKVIHKQSQTEPRD